MNFYLKIDLIKKKKKKKYKIIQNFCLKVKHHLLNLYLETHSVKDSLFLKSNSMDLKIKQKDN